MRIMILFLLAGCINSNEKFTVKKWDELSGNQYTNRINIVKDLKDNHLIKGLCFNRIDSLIGKPYKIQSKLHDKNHLYYTIYEKYGWDIDPVATTYLKIEINQDSCIIKCDIVEF